MRIASASLAVLVAALLLFAAPGRADAQGFSLNRYRMAPSSDEGFGVMSPAPPPHLTLDLRLGLDYAYGSLALSATDADGRSRTGYLVENSFTTHFAASLGVADFLGFFIALPVTWVQSGDDLSMDAPMVPTIGGPAAGDLALGVRAQLAGERERPDEGAAFAVGLAASLLLPTGVPESLTGDGGVGFRAVLSASVPTQMFTPIVNLGFAYRPETDYLGLARPGSELLFGVGGHLHLDPVRIEGELRGATTLTSDQAFKGDAVPIEALLGAHFDLGAGVTTGVAVDFGLTQGIGVPAVRVLATLGFSMPLAGDGSGDPDGDDDDDFVGTGSDDRDGDGIADDVDECPASAEDADGNDDGDGCPEDDADGDGSPDTDDFCPNEPETVNGYVDDDGCPEVVEFGESEILLPQPLLFEHRRARLGESAEGGLDLLAEALNENPAIALVQVEGHAAANEGNMNRSLRLSELRAEAVLEYLREKGVDAARLTFVGMGSDVPAEEGAHADNRRVTFRILERR